MARLLVRCLENIGYQVDIASTLRAFLPDPDSVSDQTALTSQADAEVNRLSQSWRRDGAPALWFCYHPYYKSPDLIGPEMCRKFNVPYVTAEASYSNRRRQGCWDSMQHKVLESINSAAVNICFTARDREGLKLASDNAKLVTMKPFIDTTVFRAYSEERDPVRMVVVAMMRAGDKLESYRQLACALGALLHLRWTLSIVGAGKSENAVRKLFDDLPAQRIQWHGLLDNSSIAELFSRSGLYVWPGCGEAYGLAYLEAQAAGLPVVAFDTAGVPEVVDHGHTGVLTPVGDVVELGKAIASFLSDPERQQRFSSNARNHVHEHHSQEPASASLQRILRTYT